MAAALAALIVAPAALADHAPPPRKVDSERALAIAKALPNVRAEAARHRGTHWDTELKGDRWRSQLWTDDGELVAEIFVARTGGKVLEQWTGYQAAWSMARGYPGAFGHQSTALWVWLPLLALFLIGLLPRGRPTVRALDLVAVAGLSVSFAAFNRGRIDLSTPLLYPPMLWLLGRMLWRGLGPGERRPASRGWLRSGAMWIGIVFLVGFRVALVVADGNVIDVGEASVIGGNRLVSGKQVYGHFPKRIERGDTYGPVTWAAYAPFALVFDADSKDGRMAAATAAAVVFDLLCLLGLALLGRRLRGPPGAVVAAWFWVTCPFTLYVSMCAANDGLVALATVLPLLAVTVERPVGGLARGAAAVASGLSKFAGLALLPLFARSRGSSGRSAVALYVLGVLALFALAMAPYVGDPLAVWERTIGYQDARGAPFSAWGLYGLPEWTRMAWQGFALALAVMVAIVPRAARRDVVTLAALSVAVLIAVELSAVYWFYTYIAWFLPALAVLAVADVEPSDVSSPAAGPARSSPAPIRSPG